MTDRNTLRWALFLAALGLLALLLLSQWSIG
jgi:hypothetical protein